MVNLGDILRDRYRIDAVIGRGGHGAVYQAWDIDLERTVALKLMRPLDEVDAERRASFEGRFRAEAKVAARISHPNVVTIHDVSAQWESELYIVMEYLEGRDLRDELDDLGCLDLQRAVALFVPSLEGLAEGHALGIVHKDLKPSNLLLTDRETRQEQLRVIDFGVAHMSTRGRRTRKGRFAGTPRYAAPEYARDDQISPAIDVYQMGLILAEATTGMPAVQPGLDQLSTLMKHIEGDLLFPPSTYEGAFGRVLRRALTRDPTLRYQSGGEMADALRGLTTDEFAEWERLNESLRADARRVAGSGRVVISDGATPVLHATKSPAADDETSAETVVEVFSAHAPTIVEEHDPVPGGAPATESTQTTRSRTRILAIVAFAIAVSTGAAIILWDKPSACTLTDGIECEARCTVDLLGETTDCPDEYGVEFTDAGRGRARIEMPSPHHMLLLDARVCNPRKWVLHIADSPTNDGAGGDAGTTAHDAELYLYDRAIALFGSDNSDPRRAGRLWSANLPDFAPPSGCLDVRFGIADRAVTVEPVCRMFISNDMLRLDPPTDAEGTPDRVWHFGFNQTYRSVDRLGSGLRSVELCVAPRPDRWPKSPRSPEGE